MSLKYPIISLKVMKRMFPSFEQEAEAIAKNGMWYYSVPEGKFLSYIPSLKVCIDDVEPLRYSNQEARFKIRKLSSVYEVTVKDGFPSSLLLAENLKAIVEQYLDLNNDLYVTVLDTVSAPIIIGNKAALERLVFPSWEDSYILKPLKEFLKEGES